MWRTLQRAAPALVPTLGAFEITGTVYQGQPWVSISRQRLAEFYAQRRGIELSQRRQREQQTPKGQSHASCYLRETPYGDVAIPADK